MIRMIAGKYGLYKDGRVIGMTRESGPFEAGATEELRLVSLGIAEYVDAPAEEKASESVPPAGDDAPPVPELPEGVEGIPMYGVDSSVKELREIGKMCGLTFKVGTTKEEMVAALDAHIAENTVDGVTVDGDDAPPVFNAAEAVQ